MTRMWRPSSTSHSSASLRGAMATLRELVGPLPGSLTEADATVTVATGEMVTFLAGGRFGELHAAAKQATEPDSCHRLGAIAHTGTGKSSGLGPSFRQMRVLMP